MGNVGKDFQYKVKNFSPLSLDKIKIDDYKEFSLDFNKAKAKDLYEKSLSEKDETERLKLLEQSLNLNNINEKVIINYLQILDKKDKNKYKEEKKLYAPAISMKNFDSLFKEETSEGEVFKKINPKDNIKKMIEVILKYNRRDIHSKHTIFQYFYHLYSENEFKSNVDFSFEDNEELYTLFLYEWIYSEIHTILAKIYDGIKRSNKEFQKKINEFCSFNDDIDIIQKSRTEDIDFNNTLIFLYSNVFRYFSNATSYINYFSDLIKYCLDNWNKESLYIFSYIMHEMIDYIIGNKKFNNPESKEFIELKNYYISTQKKNNIENFDLQKFNKMKIKIEGNDLILNIYGKVLKLENYKLYNLSDLLYNLSSIDEYHEISFNIYKYKFINIKYFNENNIIRACDKFISNFLKYIGKSETILSLLNTIFPGYSNYDNIKFESWLSSYLLAFYKKIIFYKQNLMALALTKTSNLEINYFFFVDDNENIGLDALTFSNVVVNLGFFIYSFYHESLGHLLLRFLNILTKMNYESPRNASNEIESGKLIESLLFSQRKKEYSIYELIYIIDIDNYKVNFKTFRKNFGSVNMKYKPSKHFIDMIKDIGLETEKNLEAIKSKKKITNYKFGISNANDEIKYGLMNLDFCVVRKEETEKIVKEFHRKINDKYGSMEKYFDKIFSLLKNE